MMESQRIRRDSDQPEASRRRSEPDANLEPRRRPSVGRKQPMAAPTEEANDGQPLDGSRKPSIPRVPQPQPQQQHQHQHQQSAQQQQMSQHHQSTSSSAFRRLVGACKQKNLDTIKQMLSEQPELINQRDRYNRNLLHYTVILFKSRDDEELRDVAANAGSCSFDSNSDTANWTTMTTTSDDDHDDSVLNNLACFDYLLDRCNVKLWWQQDLDGLSLLHLAVISSNVPLVKYVIYEHPFAIKYPLVCTLDNERHSPLHWAVITNNLECVRLLINSSAGVKLIEEADYNGATPLHYATQTNDYPKYRRQLRLMLRNVADHHPSNAAAATAGSSSPKRQRQATRAAGAKFESSSSSRRDHSLAQAHHNGLEVLETLIRVPQVNIECVDKDRRTPLLWAASSGNRDAVLLLTQNGANPTSCDINMLGALHCAASHGFTDCLECLLSIGKRGSLTTSSALASERSVNQVDNLNCTPLFYAVLSGNIDCVELLIDRGAQLDWQDSKGRSAAHFAALKGQLNSLKLLHRRGANLWLANRQGDLPLHYAIKGGRHQVVRWLLDHSPYENSVNAINNFGRAPIHLAIQRDDTEMLQYLIRRGANLNQLVKVRDRAPPAAASRRQQPQVSEHQNGKQQQQQQLVLVNGGGDSRHQTRSGAEHHYETALDLAKRLGHDASLRLLLENEARAAGQVMSGRISAAGAATADSSTVPSGNQPRASNVRSLFDLQSVDGPSPIGFDTSSSSAAASPHQSQDTGAGAGPSAAGQPTAATPPRGGALPKMSRPRPDSLPQSDSSGGSSALSQNSLTSIRGLTRAPVGPATVAPTQAGRREDTRHDSRSGPEKPFKGGISYNNERINASIKCKLYDGFSSFPPLNDASGGMAASSKRQARDSRHQSAPNSGQEIITNVNVYTSPCPLAHCQQLASCPNCSARRRASLSRAGGDESMTSDGPTTETSGDEAATIADEQWHGARGGHLPGLHQQQQQQQQQQQPTRPMTNVHRFGAGGVGGSQLSRLPPSQFHEQHLPVILSEREEVSTASGETSNDRSPEVAAAFGDEPAPASGQPLSPAHEEPRFDRAERGAGCRPAQAHASPVRSPVGEYIRAPLSLHQEHPNGAKSNQHHPNQHSYASHHLPDFSQVRPKVDSHLRDEYSSRSSRHAGDRQQQLSRQLAAGQPHQAAASRSCSRQTYTREHRRHSSQDSLEMALGVERSIRKYKLEKRLFEELQGLKRSQIRSGRANEAVLVKRLVEHLRQERMACSSDLIGLDNYAGPYSYKAYERFLYDQLRKLSQSNCAKLSQSMRDFEAQLRASDSEVLAALDDDAAQGDAEQHRDYLDEDLRADLELKRVIGADEKEEIDTLPSKGFEPADEGPAGPHRAVDREQIEHQRRQSQEEERETKPEPEVTRRASNVSLGSSSRRSSLEIEADRMRLLPLRVAADQPEADGRQDEPKSEPTIEDEASSLCSAIMTDALGNISSRSPAFQDGDDPPDDELGEQSGPQATSDEGGGGEEGAGMPSDEAKKQAMERRAQMRSRRRSVVNIGNKLEVIYHDVGIEIEPVGDAPQTDDDDGSSSMRGDEESTRGDDAGESKEVESAAGEKSEKEVDGESGETTSSATKPSSSRLDDVAEERERTDAATGAGDSAAKIDLQDEVAKEAPNQEGEVGNVLPSSGETDRARTATRRASSPPCPSREIEQPMRLRSQRRIGSIDSCKASDGIESKKVVFNGYDLDEMHQKRKSPNIKQHSSEGAPQGPHREMSEPKPARSASRRIKRYRSVLPAKRFRPRVNLDEIKQRWSSIKAAGRKCCKDNRDQLVQGRHLAKSQPNLEQARTDAAALAHQLRVDHSEGQEQYQLLYEINLKARRDRKSTRSNFWCQRKVAKIVDVRTLKRTLSLPESIIYSNDLLKKFNILKL